MQVGDKFASFSELESALQELAIATPSQQFYKRSSRKIEKSRVTHPLHPDLIYYEIKYACHHGGKKLSDIGKGKGQRITTTFQSDCPAQISLRATLEGQHLEVKSCSFEHNHELSAVVMDFLDEGIFTDTNMEESVGEVTLEVETNTNEIQVANDNVVQCQYCNLSFVKESYLNKHIRKWHKDEFLKRLKNSIVCPKQECRQCFHLYAELQEHISDAHEVYIEVLKLTFSSMSDFETWKMSTEKDMKCSYLRRNSHQNMYYYMCSRSGFYNPKQCRQRRQKHIGSKKINGHCPSRITASVKQGRISVTFCKTHFGHDTDIQLLPIPRYIKREITEKMKAGVSEESILEDYRNNIFGFKLDSMLFRNIKIELKKGGEPLPENKSPQKDSSAKKRKNINRPFGPLQSGMDAKLDCIRDNNADKELLLLSEKDIHYISIAFYMEDFYVSELTDADSVEQWVRNCCLMEHSPILFYRGDEYSFMLSIMTEFQKHILMMSSKKVLCVDTIVGPDNPRFCLTTLYIMDEFDNAFPVAYCITNHIMDGQVIREFFKSMRQSTGSLSVEYFMSDNEPEYYEAWIEVMEDNSQWVWSTWTSDAKLRTELKKIKDNRIVKEVYRNIRNLLECDDKKEFHTLFSTFMGILEQNALAAELRDFIQKNFAYNYEMWAYCYRDQFHRKINVSLEMAHRTFCHIYRQGQKKRLDKFIIIVMKAVRNKMLDRLTHEMDDDSIQLAIDNIDECHGLGIAIPSDDISSLSPNKVWLLKREEEMDIYVTRNFDTCPENCKLRCMACDICVHMFSCSCLMSLINANLCQHIHGVVWKFLTPHLSAPSSPEHHEPFDLEEDPTPSDVPPECNALLEKALKETRNVYSILKDRKHTLSKETLMNIVKKLKECSDLGSGKLVETQAPPPPPAPTVYVVNGFGHNPGNRRLILPNIFQPSTNSFKTLNFPPNVQNTNNISESTRYILVPNN